MNYIIKSLSESVGHKPSLFHSYYRKLGLLLQEFEKTTSEKERILIEENIKKVKQAKPLINPNVRNLVLNNLDVIRQNFVDILKCSNSSDMLWTLYEIETRTNVNALSEISNLFEQLSHVKRGGINIYKLNGWMVHVLVAYEVVNSDIPYDNPPASISWESNIRTLFRTKLKTIYSSITPTGQFLLKIGMLAHDIGVVKAIQDHEISGPNYLRSFFDDLNINPQTLNKASVKIDSQSLFDAIALIIRYHTFINRVGTEYSDTRVFKEMNHLHQRFKGNLFMDNYVRNDFIKMLLILGIGDTVAVDDNLITERNLHRIFSSCEYIEGMHRGGEIVRSLEDVALSRLTAFVSDGQQDSLISDFTRILDEYGYNENKFLFQLYHVQEIDFGMPTLKPLNSPYLVVKIFCMIFIIIDAKLGTTSEQLSRTRVIFDHSIQTSELKEVISYASFDQLKSAIKKTGATGIVKVSRLLFTINQTPEKDILLISIHRGHPTIRNRKRK